MEECHKYIIIIIELFNIIELWKVWTQESFQKVEFDHPGERSPLVNVVLYVTLEGERSPLSLCFFVIAIVIADVL